MLTSLSLKNIKSFKNSSTLKLAPITLIYGPNSSGKSSLWKFFLALKESSRISSRNNFLNLVRSDFANIKTLSFDRSKKSSFSVNFSSEPDNNRSTIFSFNFENPKPKIATKVYDTEDLIKNPELLNELFKFNLNKDEKNALLDGMRKILENQNKIKKKDVDYSTVTVPEHLKDENENINNLKIKELEIVQENRTFITFKIVELPKLNKEIKNFALDRQSRIERLEQEKNIKDILVQHYSEFFTNNSDSKKIKFEFESKIKTSKELYDENLDGEFKPVKVFDMIGPNGPKEFKNLDTINLINYLFLPTKISKDPEIWKKYFDFLQFLKKTMLLTQKKLNNKEDKEIYQIYIDKYFSKRAIWLEDNFGIDPKEIPQVQKTYEKILKVMKSDLNEFIEIMAEDFETYILSGNTYLPNARFYGGFIFKIIFEEITEGFLDAYIGNFDENGNLQAISVEGEKFIEKINEYSSISLAEQIKKLFYLREELGKFKKSNFNTPFPIGTPGSGSYGINRFLSSGIHEDDKYKKKIISFLEKIDLPFEIKSKLDDGGNIRLSFENKRISQVENEIKEIPLEQSGNALKSILLLLADITRSSASIIILEEPENKLHPKIQGNLMELLAEIIKKKENQIIIETHSEHFLLRIQKLVREKNLNPNDVSINYVYLDENGEGSKIDYMELNDEGKFTNKWRHGFFNERLNEL